MKWRLKKTEWKIKGILLDNIDKIHTTAMGVDRIKRNLKIDTTDAVVWLINNSDKRDGNTLLLSSQSYRKKSKVTVSECIKPRNKKRKEVCCFCF